MRNRLTRHWQNTTCKNCLAHLARKVGLQRTAPREVIIDKWLEDSGCGYC